MALNKSPWMGNIGGASKPLIIMGKVQAGATQAIKRGEICTFNETAGYFIPANAVADGKYALAICNEEQKAEDLERYIEFIAIRSGDVFEFPLAAARAVAIGDTFTLTASDSQTLTYSATASPVAFAVGKGNYPETGTTIRTQSFAQVCFNPEVSYLYRWSMPGLKRTVAFTDAATLDLSHNGAIITNKGATGTVALTAPASVPAGYHVYLMAAADQTLSFDPKPDTASVYVKGAAQTAGKLVSVTDIGDYLHLVFDGTDWLCFSSISGADADITVEG